MCPFVCGIVLVSSHHEYGAKLVRSTTFIEPTPDISELTRWPPFPKDLCVGSGWTTQAILMPLDDVDIVSPSFVIVK